MTHNFDVVEFLEEYQKYPCLWDKSLDEYRNRVKRDHAEEMLLQFSKMPTIKELRQKIRNIRCTYNQEVAKIKKSMVTGSGSSTVYKPKLSWFSLADSFLKKNNDGVYEPDTNLTLTSEEAQENVDHYKSVENVSNAVLEHGEISKSSETELSTNRNKRVSKPQQNKTIKKSKLDNSLDNAVEALKFACSKQATTETEFTLFGKQVGLQLEKLPLSEALKVQSEIQQLLTTARLASMNDSSSSSSVVSNHNTCITTLTSQHNNDTSKNNQEEVYYELQTFNCTKSQPQPQDTPQDNESSPLTLFYNNWSS